MNSARLGFIVVLLLVGIINCKRTDNKETVSFEKTEQLEPLESGKSGLPLRIALGSMTTPKSGYAYYKKMLDYIGKQMNRPVRLVDKKTYSEVNELLKYGEVDMAFVCGRPYVDGHDEFNLELLVAPRINREIVYYSYIIVHKNSGIKNFKDLRGKIFAFTDPMSNSGKLAPAYMLEKMGETPDSFFKKFFYTYAHDNSIKAVAQKVADGAAVDSLIWEYEMKFNPEFAKDTRIIKKSEPYGIPPIVVPRNLSSETKSRLRNILLTIHESKEGKAIIEGMGIDKFVIIQDKNYDSIRKMREFVKTN